MKAKFKVGDIVKGITPVGSIYNITTNEMHEAEVVNVGPFDPSIITIKILNHEHKANIGNRHTVLAKYFELVEKKQKPIVIYRKDNQVIALDQSTGKKGIATCCPTDTFDFNVGAKLAFARLMGEEIKTEPAAPEAKAAQKPAFDPESLELLKLLSDSLDVLERIERLGVSK